MPRSVQLNIPPMEIKPVASAVASVGKKVVPLVDLLLRAFVRCGRKAGNFPRPVPKPGRKAWRSSDIDRWISTRAESALGRL